MLEIGKIIEHIITITPSHNKGFIVKIGCGRFVAENPSALIGYLSQYFADPEKYEKEYTKLNRAQPEVADTQEDTQEDTQYVPIREGVEVNET